MNPPGGKTERRGELIVPEQDVPPDGLHLFAGLIPGRAHLVSFRQRLRYGDLLLR